MARPRTVWRCQECGATAPKWLGRCPECATFGSFVEEAVDTASAASSRRAAPAPTVPLGDVEVSEGARVRSGVAELDRVLGGGFVPGSLVLLGGEPGIGKSTLLLQAAAAMADSGARVLYVCGEESPAQVRLRAQRLGPAGSSIALLPEVDIARVEATALADPPDLLVVDSIQTAFDPELAGAPGSVGQVRASTARLMRLAKDHGITTVLVGHVTKEGSIAGPRVLEHMVDTVLYFEGDRDHAFRIVRSVKNRFGAADEIGVFEMTGTGLVPVEHPSAMLLDGRRPVAGSVVLAAMEGSRPVLVEVQALVTPSYLQMPRRLANGVDNGRLLQVLAVLERHAGMPFGQHDVYVSLSGGMRVTEPAADLALALALASARRGAPLEAGLVAFGEIGLTGEVRAVTHLEARVREAGRLGFTTAVTGRGRDGGGTPARDGIELRHAVTLADALSSVPDARDARGPDEQTGRL